jgi:hypothetical protein
LWQKDFGVKAAHKMLVKLTPAGGRNLQLIYPNCLTMIQTFCQKYFNVNLEGIDLDF